MLMRITLSLCMIAPFFRLHTGNTAVTKMKLNFHVFRIVVFVHLYNLESDILGVYLLLSSTQAKC